MRSAKGQGDEACQSCGLLASREHMHTWSHRRLCRAMRAFDREAPPDPAVEGWVSGLYHYYYVTHEYRVCHACFDHLQEGGEFSSPLRHRSKMAFLVLLAIVALLIASLPILLPLLKSALWLDKAEGN